MRLTLSVCEGDGYTGLGQHRGRLAAGIDAIEITRQDVLRRKHDRDTRGGEIVGQHPGLGATIDNRANTVLVDDVDQHGDIAGPVDIDEQRHVAGKHALQRLEVGNAHAVILAFAGPAGIRARLVERAS